MKPVEVEFLMKDKLTPGMNKAEREALELRNTVRLLEAELERLRLAGETAAPNLDQSANIAQIHALEKQLEELRGKLKLLQEESESVQVTPADMPNAQRQFNGLHNSIQQMAREMPSLAMGPQMFFLAISNNLPIFTDELPVPARNTMSCRSPARRAHRYGSRSCPHFFPGRRP